MRVIVCHRSPLEHGKIRLYGLMISSVLQTYEVMPRLSDTHFLSQGQVHSTKVPCSPHTCAVSTDDCSLPKASVPVFPTLAPLDCFGYSNHGIKNVAQTIFCLRCCCTTAFTSEEKAQQKLNRDLRVGVHVPSTAAPAPRPSGTSPFCPVPSPPGQARRSADARPRGQAQWR